MIQEKQKTQTILNKRSKVFIATFAPYEKKQRLSANGMVEPLISFFSPRVEKLTVLIQPHSGSDRIDPLIEEYKNGKQIREIVFHWYYYLPIYLFCYLQNTGSTHISFKLRDLYSAFFTLFWKGEPYNFFIGLESINTLAGILLKKIGRVKTVIYYVSDYSPNRFGKTLFNSLYVSLDRFCAYHADYIWDVSPAMKKARMDVGLQPEHSAPVIDVPNGLFPSQITVLPIAKRKPYTIVFMGSLGIENGPDIVIEALPIIMKKFPSVTFHVIGGGNQNLQRLKQLTKKLHLEKQVIFYGYILSNTDMAKIIQKCSLAVAPYKAIPHSVRWYADATKIRQYVGCGLPVITTHVPPLGKKLVKENAGFIVRDTSKDIAKTVDKIFTDKNLYKELAKNAERMSKHNTWENVYSNAIQQMINKTF